MQKWEYITIHVSATPEGEDFSVDQIRQWHKNRGWNDIGYHFVIGLDGTIQMGRSLERTGAGVFGHNRNNVQICLIGGLEKRKKNKPVKDLKSKDTRTEKQKKALDLLLMTLVSTDRGKDAVIQGHRDFSPDVNGDGIISPFEFMKDCPCYDAKKEHAWICKKK